ncbi:MAG: hypothetical protein R8J85_08485, partial [Mariprofundales bacterium]
MAILNIVWALLLIAAIRHLPQAVAYLCRYRLLCLAIFLYQGVRILTALVAQHPAEAAIGLFDDLRAITIGLAAIVFLHSHAERIRAAWLSFVGVTILSWWSLGWQLWHHGLQPSGDIIYG